jgi:hypothetical protein
MNRATLAVTNKMIRLAMGNDTSDTVSTAIHCQSGYIMVAIGEREISA